MCATQPSGQSLDCRCGSGFGRGFDARASGDSASLKQLLWPSRDADRQERMIGKREARNIDCFHAIEELTLYDNEQREG